MHKEVDVMEWCYGSGVDDFVVPSQELCNRLPSPGSWPKWDLSTPLNLEFPNKFFLTDATPAPELYFSDDNFYYEVEMGSYPHDKHQSSGSSVAGAFSENSFHQTGRSCDQSEHHVNGLARIEQMDDIFLSSLLEDLPEFENLHQSFGYPTELQSSVVPADNFFVDTTLDSQSISSDAQSVGSAKYLKTHACSPTMSFEKGEVADFQFLVHASEKQDRSSLKAPLMKVLIPSKTEYTNGHADEELPLEESVLHELEMVMGKLTNKMRICFRDALYRLANSSRDHVLTQNQTKNLSSGSPWICEDEKLRSTGEKTTESQTNTIDRAIANLMFNKMDLNVQDFPVSASGTFSQEISGGIELPNHSSNHTQNCSLPGNPVLPGDGEVPIFGQGHLKEKQKPI